MVGLSYCCSVKVTFSGLGVVEASGKLGDDVTARNRHGFYTRTKGKANFTGTAFQLAWNGYLTAGNTAWSALTPAQIDAWNRTPYTIRRTRYLPSQSACSGQRAFLHFYMMRAYCGAPPPTDPVTPSLLTPTAATSAAFDTGTNTFTLQAGSGDNLKSVLLWATPGLPPGSRYWKKAIRLLSLETLHTPGPDDFSASYLSRFSAPAPGDFIAVVLVPIDKNVGNTGAPQLLTLNAT